MSKKTEIYKSQYGAKFAREKKDKSTDWATLKTRSGYELRYVGK